MPVYDSFNDITLFVLYGDDWRYRDLIADGGTFDSAMVGVGYDDSSWSVGPQPFRNGYATTFFTFDELGKTGGTPDVPGTVVTASPTRIDVVARTKFTVPADALINPVTGLSNVWVTTITAVQDMQFWLDGVEVSVLGPVTGFTEVVSANVGPLTVGVHEMAFHLDGFLSAQPPGFTVPGAMGGATVAVSHLYTPGPPPPDLAGASQGTGSHFWRPRSGS